MEFINVNTELKENYYKLWCIKNESENSKLRAAD